MKSNEKGMILPLMLVISLVTASLLITVSHRLESQARSYEHRQIFQKVTLLEKECIERVLELLADPNFILTINNNTSDSLTLHNGTIVTLNYLKGSTTLVINYNFSYNSYLGKGNITYNRSQHTYILN